MGHGKGWGCGGGGSDICKYSILSVYCMSRYNLQSFAVMEETVFFPFFIACLTVTDLPISSMTKVSVTVLPDLLGVQDAELLALLNLAFVL